MRASRRPTKTNSSSWSIAKVKHEGSEAMKFSEFSCKDCVAWGEDSPYLGGTEKRQCFLDPPPYSKMDGRGLEVPNTHPDFKCWKGFWFTREDAAFVESDE